MKTKHPSMNELFALAKQEAPRTSVSEVEASFRAGIALSGGATVSAWSKLLNLKTGIMMIGTGVVLISGLMLLNMNGPTEAMAEQPLMEATMLHEAVPVTLTEPVDSEPSAEPKTAVAITQEPDTLEQLVVEPTVDDEVSTSPMRDEVESENEVEPESDTVELLAVVLEDEVETTADEPEIVEAEPKEVRYVINSSTTEEDLKKIMSEAEKAGIRMSYTARIKRNMVRKLHMHLTLTRDGSKMQRRINVYSGKGNNFTTNVAWRVDEEGKAVDFAGEGSEVKVRSSCN